MMPPEEISKIDPKCWSCGQYTKPKPPYIYGPNICLDCFPGYSERVFVFNRPTQEEMEELFSTKRGMTCQ